MKRRTPIRRKKRKPRPEGYDEPDYRDFLAAQDCAVASEANCYIGCSGRVEVAHVGDRGVGQTCPDREAIPLCGRHHRADGHDHATFDGKLGFFGSMTKQQRRDWYAAQIKKYRALYKEQRRALYGDEEKIPW